MLPRTALWIAFYLAPLITTTVVADALLSILRARAAHERFLREHVVLVGSGDLALAYLAAVQAVDPERRVLLLEHRADLAFPEFGIEEGARNLTRVRAMCCRTPCCKRSRSGGHTARWSSPMTTCSISSAPGLSTR